MAAHSLSLSPDEELHWLAMILVPGLGTLRANLLIDRFRSPVQAFRATPEELQDAGLPLGVAQSVASGCTFDDAVAQQQAMRKCGATLVTRHDPLYPRRLANIFDPPVALFARGRTELLPTLGIGVVGTRRPTPYGVAAAERLAGDLARAGLTVTSGLARGIDTAAHKAALAADGATIAVLGCGADMVYPTENRRLFAEVAERGLLLSEFPMGAPPYPQNFPIRNRIVSGLSLGILVVEGAQYSGSAITARLALDQGREVFAVPGNITSKMSWGPNLLIKQGAKLVQEWGDVVAELSAEDRRHLAAKERERLGLREDETSEGPQASLAFSATLGPMAGVARSLLAILTPDAPLQLDAIVDRLPQHSSSELIAALFELELEGRVRQLPGRNFVTVF